MVQDFKIRVWEKMLVSPWFELPASQARINNSYKYLFADNSYITIIITIIIIILYKTEYIRAELRCLGNANYYTW